MFPLKDASATARDPAVSAAVEALERYLVTASGPERFRRARGAREAVADVAAYRGLARIGIAGALIPERLGGSGLAPGVAALFAERLGWALAREPFVEHAVLPVPLLVELGADALLRTVQDEISCLAWQEGPYALPAAGQIGTRLTRAGKGLHVKGGKRFVMGARASGRFIVLAQWDGAPTWVTLAADAPGVTRRDKVLADGTCWSDVDFDCQLDEAAVLARGEACLAALAHALDLANLALAGLLYGLQTRILSLTLDYLGTRVQFDRPIGSFQALQHRAVDLYMHAQIARFLIGEAVDAACGGASGAALASYASRAKARAADAGLRIAKEGIQMHGGIGFSDEYDLGLYVKRTLVLSAWLGNAPWHRRRCAALDVPGMED